MNVSQRVLIDDLDFKWLEDLVRAAGDIALEHFRRVTTELKPDRTVVTIADEQVEAFLRDSLSRTFPADGMLGEEMGASQGQSERVWAIDPIDGTSAYAAGLPVWGVSLGVLQNWEPVAGIFFLPLLNELYLSHGYDALLNGRRVQVERVARIDDQSFLSVTSASHRKYRIDFVGKTRSMGSTAASMCYVARGTAVAALLGRPSLWDIAGALPVLRAAGGDLRCLDGRPLDLARLADGRKCADPVLAGAPWALDYFSDRIEIVG